MSESGALVIEGAAVPRRLRRPTDLARLVLAVAATAATGLIAYVAQSTTSGLDQDITQGANRLPAALLLAASLLSGFGSIALPGLASIDLLTRRRYRQAIESIGSLLAAVVLLAAATWAVTRYGSDRLILTLAGPGSREAAVPFNAVLGGLTAFATVTRVMSRGRWQVAAAVVIGSVVLADFITGGITAAALGVSALTGWAIGLLVRYVFGTNTTRPSGYEIAEAVHRAGFPLRLLRAAEGTEAGRRYEAVTTTDDRLDVIVLDRDLEGAGLAMSLYRSLRLRDSTGGGTSMRGRLERTALVSWAVQAANINTPSLLAVAQVGPDAAVLVYQHVSGRRFSAIKPTVGDAELTGAWEILRDLQQAGIVHRAVTPDNFTLASDGKVYVNDVDHGAVAASDVLLRIDLAEALCTLALISDAQRAIAAGRVVLGDAELARALPALQPFALSPATRKALSKRKDLLSSLRNELVSLLPAGEAQSVEIERIKPRSVLTFIGGTIAAYLLFGQLARVNLLDLLSSARLTGVIAGLGFSMLTYIAATMVLHGIVPERMSPWKTLQTQFAASFATLVAPPTLGSVAINVRYLTKQGLRSAAAGASVAVMQVLTSVSHLTVLLVTVILAGTTSDLAFRPPRAALIAVAVVAFAVAIAATFPSARRLAANRLTPLTRQVIPRLTSLANRPAKLAMCATGVLMLNISYCLCLVASVRAFTDEGTVATIALVYLSTSVIAVAAPTPGGLGAIEAATVAGLTATGIDAGIAVSATLLFRLWTFWVPTLPGWIAFNNLQRTGDL